jgi:hypothetical protein
MKTLVAGWFSFTGMNVTAGDVLARDVACQWLGDAGLPFEIANAGETGSGLDWRAVDPTQFKQVLFVCGPFRENAITTEFLEHFRGCRMIGLDLSMLRSVRQWNPFHVLFERDSDRTQRPDLVFASRQPRVPVAGLLLVHPQPQYGKRALHDAAGKALRRLTAARPMSVVPIDTCLEGNRSGLRSPAEIESLVARMDLVLTTRLHGLVLALKHGIPALAVDPIAGGAKIRQQCEAVGWPVFFTADQLVDAELGAAFDFCRTDSAYAKAAECRLRAREQLELLRHEFVAAASGPTKND